MVGGLGGRDAGGVDPVRLALGRAGGLGDEGSALVQCSAVEFEWIREADRAALAAADGSPGADRLADGRVAGGAQVIGE